MSDTPIGALTAPASRMVPITASATPFAPTRGVFIETAGSFTLRFKDEPGTDRTVALPIGVYAFRVVVCSAGSGLWALY